MTEREKVLLQREAIRTWFKRHGFPTTDATEEKLRGVFPLPPKREPRVVAGDTDAWEYRLSPSGAHIEARYRGDVRWFMVADAKAVFEVAASPYIEVPDPEDAP